MTEQQMIAARFNGYLPVVVDVETGGVDCRQDALLEMAAVCVQYDATRGWVCDQENAVWHEHIEPFEGARCEAQALAFNKIIPDHPLRFALDEGSALRSLVKQVKVWLKQTGCRRAVLVGHNAHFDLNFLMQAVLRCDLKHFPFHAFTCFDTATLGGFLYGQTVLAQVMRQAQVPFDVAQAHGALYDAQKTAELFCVMLNKLQSLQVGAIGDVDA
jgi:ribonuclease T